MSKKAKRAPDAKSPSDKSEPCVYVGKRWSFTKVNQVFIPLKKDGTPDYEQSYSWTGLKGLIIGHLYSVEHRGENKSMKVRPEGTYCEWDAETWDAWWCADRDAKEKLAAQRQLKVLENKAPEGVQRAIDALVPVFASADSWSARPVVEYITRQAWRKAVAIKNQRAEKRRTKK